MGWLPYWEIPKIIDRSTDERERFVLGMRLQGYTFRQIGDTIDRSPQLARQIEQKAWARFQSSYNRAKREADKQ